jgi:hypothetical protein
MAGTCIEGIAFAQLLGGDVTCLDLQKDLLAKGALEAQRRGLEIRVISGDSRELAKSVRGKFHLITAMGEPLGNFDLWDFDQVVCGAKSCLEVNGTLLVEHPDDIFDIFPRSKSDSFLTLKPPRICIHTSSEGFAYDAREGYFERLCLGKAGPSIMRSYLWSPSMVNYILRKNGLSHVFSRPYLDPFFSIQTYISSARQI